MSGAASGPGTAERPAFGGRLVLERGALRAVVVPGCGGSLAELSWLGADGERTQLLRRAPPAGAELGPEDAACFPLVPWSNRISGGGFDTPSGPVRLAPNRPGEPFPLHGEGWLLPWQVAARDEAAVTLVLDRSGAAPYAYVARLAYALVGAGLRMRLEVTHAGARAMPYGLGFHPWFPYLPGTRLRARAGGMWLESAEHLPGALVDVPEGLRLDGGAPLPDRWVNNAFRGWDGRAELRWPAPPAGAPPEGPVRGVALSCSGAAYFVLYHPPGAGFVCVEPVTHPVDAFHLPPPHRGEGLAWLPAGESTVLECTLSPAP